MLVVVNRNTNKLYHCLFSRLIQQKLGLGLTSVCNSIYKFQHFLYSSSYSRFEIPPELLEEMSGSSASGAASVDETSNDLMMAQMLQMEFDKEADEMLRREQNHYNKNSKVGRCCLHVYGSMPVSFHLCCLYEGESFLPTVDPGIV